MSANDEILDPNLLHVNPAFGDHVEVPNPNKPDAQVPCGTCRLCCQGFSAVMVLSDHGDDPLQYDTMTIPGLRGLFLKFKINGDCVYLGPDGCTIHGKTPFICRTYDCREQFRMYNKRERETLVKEKRLDARVLRRAAILIHQESKLRRG